MAILFFDTETTGKVARKKDATDAAQPDLVQLAAILCDEDLNEVASLNCIVYPQSWVIPDEAANIHGISQAKALKYGVSLPTAFNTFVEMSEVAERFVAHNIEFDTVIMQRAAARLKMDVDPFGGKQMRCTMKASKPILKLPNKSPYIQDAFKFPKLIEVYEHFFNEGFDGAHDALVDVRATIRVYKALCAHYGMQP